MFMEPAKKIRIVPITLFLLCFMAIPLLILFVYSFWIADNGSFIVGFSLENYATIFKESLYLSITWQTIEIGIIVSVISVTLSILFCYAIIFHLPKWRNQLLFLTLISMLSSYLVRIYAWKSILGSSGVLNQFLLYTGLVDQPLTIFLYNKVAVIITLVHILLPLSVLPIFTAMQNIDKRVIEASRDLGAPAIRTFFSVVVPLSLRGVLSSFIFVFILAAGDYVTPQLMGGTTGVLLGRVIYDQFAISFNWPFGSALSFFLLAVFLVMVAIYYALRKTRGLWSFMNRINLGRAPAGRTYRVRTRRRIQWPLASVYTILIMAFLYIPLLLVVLFSFNASRIGSFPIHDFSMKWYEQTFNDPIFLIALKNSMWLGGVTVLITVPLALLGSLAITRDRIKWEKGFMFLLSLPITMPGIIIGIALLSFFTLVGAPTSIKTAVVGHVLYTIPFVVMVLNARLKDFDRRIEEAGRDLGAGPLRVFWSITLPNIAVGLVGSGLLVFALSLDEFLITNFTIGSDATLPTLIWSMMRRGISPSINVVATILLTTSIVALIVMNFLGKTSQTVFGNNSTDR